MKYGLLGRTLGHSYSPLIHGYLGVYPYKLIERKPEEIEDFLKHTEFQGINVTVPYKKRVIRFLDELSPIAEEIGAVNTVIRKNGRLIGHNTDYFGFQSMLLSSGLNISGKKVLVLGSGGASNTVTAVLEHGGANVVVVSRTGENNYGNLDRHSDASLIVNTTPVGMYPHVGESPVALELFPKLEGVLDVIYNPARTKLLMDAQERGLVAENGLLMLVAQAKEAAEWFTGQMLDNSLIPAIHRILAAQMQNIVLIGMPGSGKSTVGAALAKKLDRSFVDTDQWITDIAKKPIPEIFAQDGEEAFRRLESDVLQNSGRNSGKIIATGGGCVTREENYRPLHQNGRIFWLQRDLQQLPTEGRPLSQSTPIQELYARRKPMYEAFADHIIDNNGTTEQTVAAIITILEEEMP